MGMLTLWHLTSGRENEIDEVLIVAPQDATEEEVLKYANDHIWEPQVEGCYELVWNDTTRCTIAEFRGFVG